MRVYFSNLGCKLNQAEVDSLVRQFVAAGHTAVKSLEEADLHVVNSCTVTHLAARDSRKTARRGRRSAELRTVLTGCYATASPEEAAKLGVDLVVPNRDKERLLELVHRAFPQARPSRPPAPCSFVPSKPDAARVAVKIEDGCNMRCSFCIIPLTRGRQRSRRLQEILTEVEMLVARGAPEVVLTGVQISAYRDHDVGLTQLVKTLLQRTAAPRLRLTSIAPWQLDDSLLSLWPNDRLCRHLHLSLQSGCDETLRRMRRPYTTRRFAEVVERVRQRIPGVAVTTDVITGFPGESEEEFARSLAFVDAMRFARIHVFTYSPRAGTAAMELARQVPPAQRRERTARLLDVAARAETAFRKERLGERATVVWEDRRHGWRRGTTDNYLRAFADVPSPSRRRCEEGVETVEVAALRQEGVLVQPVGAGLTRR